VDRAGDARRAADAHPDDVRREEREDDQRDEDERCGRVEDRGLGQVPEKILRVRRSY